MKQKSRHHPPLIHSTAWSTEEGVTNSPSVSAPAAGLGYVMNIPRDTWANQDKTLSIYYVVCFFVCVFWEGSNETPAVWRSSNILIRGKRSKRNKKTDREEEERKRKRTLRMKADFEYAWERWSHLSRFDVTELLLLTGENLISGPTNFSIIGAQLSQCDWECRYGNQKGKRRNNEGLITEKRESEGGGGWGWGGGRQGKRFKRTCVF